MIAVVGLAMIAAAFLVTLPLMAAFEAANLTAAASLCSVGMAALLIGGVGLLAIAFARHMQSLG